MFQVTSAGGGVKGKPVPARRWAVNGPAVTDVPRV